ncbi:MAG: helix-turn-helix domain-containing protein [Beijerinckiaceae bacterium]
MYRAPLAPVGSGANRIKVWREHRNLTIPELATAAGLSQPYVSQIESGARKGRRGALAALAAVLRVGVEDVVG